VVETPAVLSRLRPRVTALLGWIDGFVARLANASINWLVWPVLYAITSGSAAWMLTHLGRMKDVDVNKVGLPDSIRMALCVGGAFGLILLLYVGRLVWTYHRTREWRLPEIAGDLNRRLRPLLALPVLPGLTLAGVEKDSPKLTFAYIVLAALAIGWGVYGWVKAPEPERFTVEDPEEKPAPTRARRALGKGLVALAVGALWAGYGFFFSRLSIINHHALNTRTIDLGYYDNIFYQSIHGRPLACTLIRGGYHGSAHFDPLLVLLSPLYLLYPRAEMILVLQAVWLGAGVVPMYLLAREKLGKPLPSLAIAFMYALFPALHGANMYEFHSLTLLSPIILWLLYFLERGSTRGYYLTLIPALLLREDVPLLLCFVAIYAILSGRPGYARKGWVTIVVSLCYFTIVKKFFMASSEIFMTGKEALSFAYYYEDLIPNKNGAGGLVVSVLSNPWFIVKHVFTEPKILYFLTLFVPLAFLPFFARTGRIMLAYGLLFCFLATRTAVFSPAFQYSSVILPIAFALTPMALRQLEDDRQAAQLGLNGRKLSRAWLAVALVASLLCSWKFGGVFDNQAFRGGFGRVARGLGPKERETYAWVRENADKIPLNESVGTTNKLGCHVSNRKEVYFYPYAAPNTDWVFIDESELKGGDLERHNRNIQGGKLQEISRHGKMVLFKRKR